MLCLLWKLSRNDDQRAEISNDLDRRVEFDELSRLPFILNSFVTPSIVSSILTRNSRSQLDSV